ncbi:hypothetical protein [Acidiphilium acidophilum]|uniref:hypothetical protein n=1 Tax=Acidiphilium acidophilum TaxID=76588 RepID=UPI002E8E6983|nr:hypothetical protein [Acidiphilium acidophilum]
MKIIDNTSLLLGDDLKEPLSSGIFYDGICCASGDRPATAVVGRLTPRIRGNFGLFGGFQIPFSRFWTDSPPNLNPPV